MTVFIVGSKNCHEGVVTLLFRSVFATSKICHDGVVTVLLVNTEFGQERVVTVFKTPKAKIDIFVTGGS